MKTNKVSIIVPVYNAESYLDECISSILAQRYSNFELILINDGSVDKSRNICHKWAKIDERIIEINNSNHGVSYSRNNGLKICCGDYITFVDADDLILPEYIAELVKNMQDTNSEMSVCGYRAFKTMPSEEQNRSISNKVRYYEDNLETLLFTITKGMVWGKLYLREVISKYEIQFDESISVSEDLLFNFDYLKHCNRVVFSSAELYMYRQLAGSVIHNNHNIKWFDCIRTYEILENRYASNKAFPYIHYNYLKVLYEGKTILRDLKLTDEETGLHIDEMIRLAEKEKCNLPLKRKIYLAICKYLFVLVIMKRELKWKKSQ